MASETVKNVLKTTNNSEVAQSPKKGMQQLLKVMESEIKSALPSMVSTERFQRVVLTAFSSNPNLQRCEPMSFIASVMTSAQLGLEPNTPLGHSYIIPYGSQASFQIGYKGLLDLAHRSGKIKTIYAHEVKENDQFDIDYGLEQKLSHKPLLTGERGETIGYYAVYHTVDNGYSFVYMSKHDIEAHKEKYSKSYKMSSSPWQTAFDEMAKKTVIKQLLKYAPLSIELQKAINMDESVKNKIDLDMDLVEEVQEEEIVVE